MKQYILFVIAAVLFGAAGWLLGARHALSEAAAIHNAASLVFFTGTHQALLDGDIATAKRTLETAVSAHIFVIQNAHKISLVDTINQFFDSNMSGYPSHTLKGVYSHFQKHPDSISPEAMSFLKSNAEQKK